MFVLEEGYWFFRIFKLGFFRVYRVFFLGFCRYVGCFFFIGGWLSLFFCSR